jgi:signal transduction histidine kinase
LGRLTDGAFHEILNPLNIISGHIQVLQKDDLLSPRVSKYLANMKEQSERIARIVNGLLQFSRHCEYERGKLNINEIIDGVLILLHHELMLNNIIVSKKFYSDLPEIYGNEEQISQVLYNIIFNARDAMAEGGTLEISTGIEHDNIGGSENNEYVYIDIKDTGCGIPENYLDKIFDPFFTTKETGKRTGLGLSLSYGIIEEHGGEISAGNNSDKGAFFRIQLPVAA